jgi:AcrR family transcriptional regulator
MRAQSLYGYFPSKHALLDALFAQGYADLLARVRALPLDGDPRTRLRRHAHAFVDFAVEDLPRYQLLFQRTVPGFEPSTASYELSVAALGTTRAALAACGIGTTHDVDLYTAVLGGVVAQQNANEPGGHRWTRLVDEALDMYLAHVRPDDQEPP